MRLSLRSRLFAFWILLVALLAALGALVFEIYEQGAEAQIRQGEELASGGCDAIGLRYALYIRGFAGQAPDFQVQRERDLEVLVNLVLDRYQGVEGGLWHRTDGFAAYAFPTYEGSGPKKDVPEAERPKIEALARLSLEKNLKMGEVAAGEREARAYFACPAGATPGQLAAWTMKRIPAAAGATYDRLRIAIIGLFGFALASGLWLGWTLQRWTRRFEALERTIATQPVEKLPSLEPTGEAEIDRIAAALKEFGSRLEAERRQSAELSRKLALGDRLAALGRVAAGIAHEIRNPIATMRLKAENALAKGAGHHAQALQSMMVQIDRLERLLANMLAMTQELRPSIERVAVAQWIAERVGAQRERAEAAGVRIETDVKADSWPFDPLHLGRALDNLLVNAIQHSPRGGRVLVEARSTDARLLIAVQDSGAGVAPGVAERLFEPFATSRADGTGLGLALAREIVAAHDGNLRTMQPAGGGARFEIELPWRES